MQLKLFMRDCRFESWFNIGLLIFYTGMTEFVITEIFYEDVNIYIYVREIRSKFVFSLQTYFSFRFIR